MHCTIICLTRPRTCIARIRTTVPSYTLSGVEYFMSIVAGFGIRTSDCDPSLLRVHRATLNALVTDPLKKSTELARKSITTLSDASNQIVG